MKYIVQCILIIFCNLFSGFIIARHANPVGTYGACKCTYLNTSSPMLILHENGSFSYKDPTGKTMVDVNGKWSQSGKKIKLKEFGNVKIHKSWKQKANGKCLKSRKGLTIYRICQN